MYRGEPLALWTITIAYFFFIGTQILGYLTLTQPNPALTQSHYYFAFLGWIGLTVLGAELQFFRAITVIKKFTPEYLRHIFLLALPLGIILLSIAPFTAHTQALTILGLTFYLVGTFIQTYWVAKKKFTRLFKFPLDYYLVAHAFFLITLLFWYYDAITNTTLFSLFAYTHILTIGWITITLQGALLRILPFFVGKSIYRPLRPHTTKHLYFTTISSSLFIIGILFTIIPILIVGSLLWAISWLWVTYVLIKSISQTDRKILHKTSLGFFIPGIIWFALGSILGLIASRQSTSSLIHAHIHAILVAGLGLIMLGAIHRIVVFQIYSIIYTGRKREKSEESLLQKKPMAIVIILYNISVIFFVSGFRINNTLLLAIGGSLLFLSTLLFLIALIPVYIHYLKYKHTALPIHLKKGEDPNTPLS